MGAFSVVVEARFTPRKTPRVFIPRGQAVLRVIPFFQEQVGVFVVFFSVEKSEKVR